MDDRNATGELCKALLQLLTVKIGRGLFDLNLDLVDAALNRICIARAIHDDGVLLGNLDLTRTAELRHLRILKLEAEISSDDFAARQDRNILQHFLAPVAKAGRLDGNTSEGAAHLIDQKGCKRFAFDIFSDNHQLLAGLQHLLQQRQNLLDVGNLLIRNQQVSVIDNCFHLIGICAHIRGNIAAVELHAFHHVAVCLSGLGLFNGNHAIRRNFLHRFSDQLADRLVAGRNRSHTSDIIGICNLLGIGLYCVHSSVNRLLDALLDHHRIGAGCNILHALANKRLCEQRSSGGAVARNVVCLGGDFLDKLCAHILKGIFQLDFLCNRPAVVGDERRAVFLIQDDVAAFRAKGDFYGIAQLINTGLQGLASLFAVDDLFRHNRLPPTILMSKYGILIRQLQGYRFDGRWCIPLYQA